MTCRTWSLPGGSAFTGLCSLKMLAETANTTKICEICVTPISVEPETPITEVDPSCRSWYFPIELYRPLCSMRFMPEQGLSSCPVCVTPVEVTE